jgi:hypothetical protein
MTISTIPPLDLETARPSASTGSLKLATLASDIRFLDKCQPQPVPPERKEDANLVLVGTETEVLDGFSGVLGTAEKESVGSSRGAQSEFIQSQSLTTGLVNASSGSGSETQGSDGKLGDGKETVVISDRADHDNGFALVRLGDVRSDARKRNRGAVDTGHEKAAQHNLVEVRFRAAYSSHLQLVLHIHSYTILD